MDKGGLAAPLPSTGQVLQPNHAPMMPNSLPLTLNTSQALHYQKIKALKVLALLADQ